ncbi:carbohydrate ABC transporter substrate-binding protein [Treponema phagedenis]|uniref:ABC transporter, solute-binding protein n=1 Tax=Treponema phagedenis TaxID=162 RepID=A0A0B7H298_TREPH|nr:ABC transporter substrate-binding protein [Treponema phagedenis]NVP25068.1 carbohydrate ABC transporter substrate-binding protein [Treponema phagedenis]QEJ94020.1 carbohydrate ABC transporter substrate-binding protein [Treponema phagedenis]QEJ97181.1 carbohydrate ABC transporter substrate-binding protein [Treponema phagedenis]QEK01972.1 carbohydrate ABC transporter substrate-binding protein [Treponema phagedenis]QEK02629.1 carbohydrate ABC transporter substrate-binding protein [Treponema ph
MKQKIIHTVLLLFVVAIAFIGCSKAETAGEKEAGTLVYWSMWEATEPQGQVIQEAISQFTADTGIAVDAQFKGRTGIREGLQPALDAGSNIDLFDEDIDRVNATWKAYLLDLEDFAKNANYEATANAGLIAACRKAGEGKLKSIPYQPNIFAVFYNKAIFDQAGVTAVPKTWEELDAACQKIKNAGFVPITNDDAYITCLFGYHMSRINGYEKTEAIVKGNQWDDPSVAETAKAYADFAKKGYFSPNIGANVWPAGQNQELAMGTAAMYLNGSWLPNEVISMTGDDFEWGCFSYPAVANGHDGVEASNFGAQVFAINKNSKNAEAAFKLITYITKGRFDKELSARSLGIPADSTNTDWPKQLKNVRPVMESLKTRYPWAAGAEANPDMTPIIKENMMKLCAGTITAEQFTANLKAASK